MSNLPALADFLRKAATNLGSLEKTEKGFDNSLLESAIATSLRESKGSLVASEVFEELVLANLVIEADKEGYSKDEIKRIVDLLAGKGGNS